VENREILRRYIMNDEGIKIEIPGVETVGTFRADIFEETLLKLATKDMGVELVCTGRPFKRREKVKREAISQ